MAGILKKIPRCTVHGKACFIKTGTKEGPMKGKSFFICGNQLEQCSFAAPASEIAATNCPYHNKISDLQAICKKDGEIRCYYRCVEGRKSKLGWCGFERLPSDDGLGARLTDVTNRQKGKTIKEATHERTDVKDPSAVDKEGTREFMITKSGKENETVISGVTGLQDFHSRKDSFTTVKSDIHPSLGPIDTQSKGKDRNANGNCCVEQNKLPINATDKQTCAETSIFSLGKVKKKSPNEVIVIDDDEEDQQDGAEIRQISNICQSEVSRLEIGQSSQKAGDSYGFENREALLRQQSALERELETRKVNLKGINLQLLPDKGQRLIVQIKELERKLDDVRKQRIEDVGLVGVSDAYFKPSGYIQEVHCEKSIQASGLHVEKNLCQKQLTLQKIPDNFNKQRLFEGRMTSAKLKQVGRVTRDAIDALHRSLESCPSATTECDDPNGLTVGLMPHQKQALAWLLWREKQMPSGGILADDMGLGKTLTSIALIMKDKQIGYEKKSDIKLNLKDSAGTLIICPASLVHHWQKEIDRRVRPLKLTVCLYHGQMRENSVERLSRYDVVLTTYSIVAIETKYIVETEAGNTKPHGWLNSNDAPPVSSGKRANHNSLISQIHWRRIILDEAHNIKNPKCATSVAACLLEAESRWALTGTPIQNNTKDLYAIIKFLRCHPFDEFKVWTKWVDDKSARGRERMNTLVRSLLLRRTKQQHLTCLPSRASKIHSVSLEAKEKEMYDLLQRYSKNLLTAFLDNRGKDWEAGFKSKERNDGKLEHQNEKLLFGKRPEELLEMFGLRNYRVNAGSILLMVLRLRQCCSHLSLLREVPDEAECKEDGIEIPLEEQMMNLSIVESDLPTNEWNPGEFKQSFVSSKLRCLLEELQKLKSISISGKQIKSVVVSQWAKMLDIIGLHLRRNGFKYDSITGRVSLKKRSEIVEDFNTNPNGVQVMLLSLRAGGVGLNLIGGSHLFLIDQHWNPALESQACDRIYRVGQQNDVVIHRFLCIDTVEEKITALQEKKKTLADSVLQGGKQSGSNLTLQDLRVLFSV